MKYRDDEKLYVGDRCDVHLPSRRSPTCRVRLGAELEGMGIGGRFVSVEAAELIREGLELEARGQRAVVEGRRQLQQGIRIARQRDAASWYAIAASVLPRGEPHRRRLRLALRLRQRAR